MKSYAEWTTHLFSLERIQKKERTLARMRTLLALLGNPEKTFPSIHIAGTNGKGSVATKIARAFQSSGYKVGLYTSPHLFSFCERIKVNGKSISEKEVVAGLEHLFHIAEKNQIKPLFFEMTTLLAFHHFAAQNLDIAVIETGLGGRLDATNIIHPILSVITNISRDHQDVLGPTLDAIAKEKGGIIKEKTPLVLGLLADRPILRSLAKEKQAPLLLSKGESNESLAKCALDYLSDIFSLTVEAKEEGLNASPLCRFQKVGANLIFDVAHNPAGFKRLFTLMHKHFPQTPFTLVLSLSKKDQLATLKKLFQKENLSLLLFPSTHPRCIDSKELLQAFPSAQILNPGLESLQKQIETYPKHLFVIAGSFYMMQELYPSVLNPSASLNIM